MRERTIYKPYSYQARASRFILDHPACALFLDMGLGKTIITLTALQELLYTLEVTRVLIIAPKSVAQNTWTAEAGKWEHLSGMRIATIAGETAKKRLSVLSSDMPIVVINRDMVSWLIQQYPDKSRFPFDCVVLDESTSFKNPRSIRFRALRKVRPYLRRIILLTGTPAPNGLMDLWAQGWLLDMGKRLFPFIGAYRSAYFTRGKHNGDIVYEWIPRKGARHAIGEKLRDISLSMKARDYLELPSSIDAGTLLEMPEIKGYRAFEKEQILELSDTDIIAATAAALGNKLLQYTSGAVYDDNGIAHEVSTIKLTALHEIIEAAGSPVLVYYSYKSEIPRICRELREYNPVVFDGKPAVLAAWNAGDIQVLLAHPASAGYGLNMQFGGHIIVWYTLTWSLELYKQANARILRQGQKYPVLIYRLICKDTIDEKVIRALENKDNNEETILKIIRELRNDLVF